MTNEQEMNDFLNRFGDKTSRELKKYCTDNGISKSYKGVTNKYVLLRNIYCDYFDRPKEHIIYSQDIFLIQLSHGIKYVEFNYINQFI